VVARLVTPSDYGLMGMAGILIGFVALFKDLGLSSATVQSTTLTHSQVSTLLWINVSASVATALAATGLAPGVAWFFDEPRLVPLGVALAAGFVASGLTVQHQAVLQREMRFGALAACDLAALTTGVLASIALATQGCGYWALAAGQLVEGGALAACVWWAGGWLPSRPRRDARLGELLAFGGNITGFTFVNYFARQIDTILIGKIWGGQELGLYAKAYQLLLLPLNQLNAPIGSVAVPALSKLRNQPDAHRRAYRRLLELLTLTTMPAIAWAIVCADWLFVSVLGIQWAESGRLFALLGAAGLIQPVLNTGGWVFISQGRARDFFCWGAVASVLIVAAVCVGLTGGAAGVAAAYSAVYLAGVAPAFLWFVSRRGMLTVSDVCAPIAPSVLATLAVLAVGASFRYMCPHATALGGMFWTFVLSAGAVIGSLLATPSGRALLKRVRSGWAAAF
jgi:PST family polysaccharide transporter